MNGPVRRLLLLLPLAVGLALAADEPVDPHAATGDDPTQGACVSCHAGAGQPAQLALAGFAACLGCHTAAPHVGVAAHLGPPSEALAPAVAASGLPLANGAVVCGTCHAAHKPGAVVGEQVGTRGEKTRALLPAAWTEAVFGAAPAGLRPVTHDHDLLRLPLEGDALCRACHDVGRRR